jgi:hypothetical protein
MWSTWLLLVEVRELFAVTVLALLLVGALVGYWLAILGLLKVLLLRLLLALVVQEQLAVKLMVTVLYLVMSLLQVVVLVGMP